MKQDVPEFVEQRENLPRLGGRIVRVNQWERVVVEAEPEKALNAKGVLENEDTRLLQDAPPRLQSRVVVAPCELYIERHAEIFAHSRGHRVRRHAASEMQVVHDKAGCRVAVLRKLGEVDLERLRLLQQEPDRLRHAVELSVWQRAEGLADRRRPGRLGEEKHRDRQLELVRHAFKLRIGGQGRSGFPRGDVAELLGGFLKREARAFARPCHERPVDRDTFAAPRHGNSRRPGAAKSCYD